MLPFSIQEELSELATSKFLLLLPPIEDPPADDASLILLAPAYLSYC